MARSDRLRRKIELSLSDEARARLDAMAAERYEGNRSAAVEALILRKSAGKRTHKKAP